MQILNLTKNHLLKGMGILILTALTCSKVQAQQTQMEDKTPEERAEFVTDKQKERIEFNDGQEQEMYAINLKYIYEMQDIMKGGRSFSTMRQLRDMSGRKDKEVKKVLEKSQYKEYLKLKDEMRDNMRAMMNNAG